jgi:hypothetical protein
MQANLPDDREAAYDLGPVLTELTDGPKTVKQTFSFQVYESWPPWGRPLAVGSADVAAAWVLVPTDRPTVAVDPEPSRRSVVEAAVAVADMTVDGQTASLTVEAMRPPIDLAYDVILSADGRQWPAGSVRFRAGKVAAHCLAVRARGLTADRVAVVLRPNAAEAAGTVDMTRVWGGEVRVRDVSVKRLSAAGEGGSGGSQ